MYQDCVATDRFINVDISQCSRQLRNVDVLTRNLKNIKDKLAGRLHQRLSSEPWKQFVFKSVCVSMVFCAVLLSALCSERVDLCS
jgi:hypothetical protein